MIDRQHGQIILECDECGNLLKGEKGEDFEVVWADAKHDGWSARKIGTDWVHSCDECNPHA